MLSFMAEAEMFGAGERESEFLIENLRKKSVHNGKPGVGL